MISTPSEIDVLLADYQGSVPGVALLLLQQGRVVAQSTHGFADLEKNSEVTEKTNFRLASVSKHFTAAAIVRLIEQKQLTLEDSLTRFFPDFPEYGKGITIYHLLTHTSGLKNYEELMDMTSGRQIRDQNILELYEKESNGVFTPGEKFEYSDGGYCVLSCIIEAVACTSFPDYMAGEFFMRLGMENTNINMEGITYIPNRAHGYSREGNLWTRTDQGPTSATMGDGGVYSSLADLKIWDAFLDTQPELFKSQVLTDEQPAPVHYSFGFFRRSRSGRELQYHRGSSIGFRTGYLRIPDEKLSVIFLSNRNEGNGDEITEETLNLSLASKG